MSARVWAVLALLLAVLLTVATIVASKPGAAGPTTLSRAAGGWFAARAYLEARGCAVALLDRPLDEQRGTGVLVTAFPWSAQPLSGSLDGARFYAAHGGTLVLAYSGASGQPFERQALADLGLAAHTVRGQPPLSPLGWRAFVSEQWRLEPEAALGGAARPVEIGAPEWVPEAPAGAQVLYTGPQGVPVVFTYRVGRGRMLLLPASTFANARLASAAGNADLLETLRQWLGSAWAFDEAHHGFLRRLAGESSGAGRAFDLLVLQLALLYVAAVLGVVRRFGPAWREAPVVSGSTASFLLGLGGLHDRLGHHGEAAALLVERVRRLEPGLELPPDLASTRVEKGDAAGLIALAARIARLREKRREL